MTIGEGGVPCTAQLNALAKVPPEAAAYLKAYGAEVQNAHREAAIRPAVERSGVQQVQGQPPNGGVRHAGVAGEVGEGQPRAAGGNAIGLLQGCGGPGREIR
jgi:hypothetical protein